MGALRMTRSTTWRLSEDEDALSEVGGQCNVDLDEALIRNM